MSVSGIAVDEDDRVLLIQRRDNGRWEPPGGVLELDETFEQGLRREWMTMERAAEVMAPAYYLRVADAFTPDVAIRAQDGVNLLDA